MFDGYTSDLFIQPSVHLTMWMKEVLIMGEDPAGGEAVPGNKAAVVTVSCSLLLVSEESISLKHDRSLQNGERGAPWAFMIGKPDQ